MRSSSLNAKKTTRELILFASIDLFNKSGVSVVSTNHIANKLRISPGNLYYHFSNKEEILYCLFLIMSEQVESHFEKPCSPEVFFTKSFEIFWEFRFFHREMYSLRRGDPKLNRKWRYHMLKTKSQLAERISEWESNGYLRENLTPGEVEVILTTIISTASSFFQMFESSLKAAKKERLNEAVDYILNFLQPYSCRVNP